MTEAETLTRLAGLSAPGLLVGSFLGLVSLRLPKGEAFVQGRSRCASCGHALPPWRLIPLLSYVLSSGRCARCAGAIPARYPLVEAGCAAIGAVAAATQPSLAAAMLTALLGWQLVLIAIIDGEHFWLPDRLTLPLLGSGFCAAGFLDDHTLLDAAIGTLAGFVGLWLIAFVYRRARGREGFGGGDPILLAAGGAWLGWVALPSVLVWASTAGLSLVLARHLTGRPLAADDRLPFGVFLATGIWLTWLFGPLGSPA